MPTISKKVLDEATAAIEDYNTAAPEFVYVEMPERDLTDYPFGGVGINLLHFGGPAEMRCDCADYPRCKTTRRCKVTPEQAREIQERLTLCRASDLRIYSNRRDMKSLIELVKNNPQYNYYDPNTPSGGR